MLLYLCFIVSFVDVNLAKDYTSQGASGELCGDVHCLQGDGVCVEHNGIEHCRCDSSQAEMRGDGSLACFKKDSVVGNVRSEPFVNTYDNVKFQLNLPCRFLATKFTSRLKTVGHMPGDRVGVCECNIFSWQRKHKGKFYPHGFDASCSIARTDSEPQNVTGFSIRKYGVATDGFYVSTEQGVKSYSPDGPWGNESISSNNHGIVTDCAYDAVNNRAFVDVESCGMRVELRPFDIIKGRYQTQPNGISFALNLNHMPLLVDNGRTIMSGPGYVSGVPLYQQMGITNTLSAEEFMLMRALSGEVEQNHPDASPECTTLHHSALMCDMEAEKKQAMDECKWMLHSQPFIKCVDDTENAHKILHLVRRCFDQACGTLDCKDFLADLRALPDKCINEAMKEKSRKLKMWLEEVICPSVLTSIRLPSFRNP